jgi:hypothetical protein
MTYGMYKFNQHSSRSKIQFFHKLYSNRIPLHLPARFRYSCRSVTTIGGRTGIGSGGNSIAGAFAGSAAGIDGIVSTGTVDHFTLGGGGEMT